MTPPDTNTILLALVTSVGWVGAWFHGRRNGKRRIVEMEKEHRQMYADYKALHGIRENGE